MAPLDDIGRALARLLPRDEGAQYWFRTGAGRTASYSVGLADRARALAVSPRTSFHCFSATKPVTALAVLQLVADGALSLDDLLVRHLPDIPYRNGATLRQVLSHQAGLPNPMPLSWIHRDEEDATFDHAAFLSRVLREHPGARRPGRKYRYSNVGFLLLGRIVEVLSGQRFTDYVRKRILDVVADGDADAYLDFGIPADRHALGYTRRRSLLGLVIGLLPDAAHIRTNEGPWIRYQPFHLDGVAYGGLKGNTSGWAPLLTSIASRDARLLPGPLYDAFFAPQPLSSGRPARHALSWFTGRLGAHDYRCHAGGGPGYGSEIRVYPETGAASALLTNTTIISDARLLDRLDAISLGK